MQNSKERNKTMNKSTKTWINKFFKNTLYSLLLVVAFLSMFFVSNLLSNSNSISLTKASSSSVSSKDQLIDTKFMHSPTYAVSAGEYVLVLDDATKSVLKIKDGLIVQGENSSISSYGASHMFKVEQNIVLLSPNELLSQKMIVSLDINTFEKNDVIFEDNSVTITQNYDQLSYYISNDKLYVLLYSLDTNGGLEHILYFSISSTTNGIFVSTMRSITISSSISENNFKENVKSINILFDKEKQLPVCLVHSNTEVFAVYIENNSDEISSLYATNIQSNTLSSARKFYMSEINSIPCIIIEYNDKIDIHELHVPITNIGDDKFSVGTTLLTINHNISSSSSLVLSGESLFISSPNDQMVIHAQLSQSGSELSLIQKSEYKNPEIEHVLYDNSNIKLMEVTNDTSVSMKAMPYSTSGIISITPGSCIVLIGYGEFRSTITPSPTSSSNYEKVNGYGYYLATVNGTNYYGYLPISAVTEIQTSESMVPYVFAMKNINVYKYPSATEDEVNTIIYTTTDIEKIHVMRDISDFSYTVGSANAQRSFIEVRINDQIGYIESSNIDRYPEIVLVQTNAKIVRGTSVYANIGDDVPTWNLIAGKRVRIIENRYGTEKWTKISFNDDDGVTCTGYVLAQNIEADSWTTLQIIGFILVLVTLVLLVIILIVRNRVNHE